MANTAISCKLLPVRVIGVAIDLAAEVENYLEMIEPFLEANEVNAKIEKEDSEVLRSEMRPETFYGILQILTANSLDWLRNQEEDPRIRITLKGTEDCCEMIFSDNGPGVPLSRQRQSLNRFSPARRVDRMGLTIARRLVELHGGSVVLLTDGRRRGANFLVSLPRKRSRDNPLQEGLRG